MNILRRLGRMCRSIPGMVIAFALTNAVVIPILHFAGNLDFSLTILLATGAAIITVIVYVIEKANIRVRDVEERIRELENELLECRLATVSDELPYPSEYIDPENRFDW